MYFLLHFFVFRLLSDDLHSLLLLFLDALLLLLLLLLMMVFDEIEQVFDLVGLQVDHVDEVLVEIDVC